MNGIDDSRIAAGVRRRINRLRPASEKVRTPRRPVAVSPLQRRVLRSRLRVAPAFTVAVLVLMVALVAGGAVRQRLQSSAGTVAASSSSMVAASSGATSQMKETARVPLAGPVYDLTFDVARDSLWFALMSPDQASLNWYDIGTGQLSQWPLPPTSHNGFLERVAIGPDGSVWVTEDYAVVRLDPSRSSMATHVFAQADPDATATALTESDPSPGTWPAGITFDSAGNALVIRHNVRSLVRLDSRLDVLGRVLLPGGLTNPGDLVDVNGVIYVAPYAGQGDTIMLSESGVLKGAVAAGTARLAAAGTEVLSTGPGGVTRLRADGSKAAARAGGGSMNDRAATASGAAIVYLDGQGVIEAISSDGSIQAAVTLVGVPSQVVNPMGSLVDAFDRDVVSAIVSDLAGSIWYVDTTRPALVHLQY